VTGTAKPYNSMLPAVYSPAQPWRAMMLSICPSFVEGLLGKTRYLFKEKARIVH
jgi:hypothetical protein